MVYDEQYVKRQDSDDNSIEVLRIRYKAMGAFL